MRKINVRDNEKRLNQGEYWTERFEQLEAAMHDKSVKKLKEIEAAYKRSLAVLDERINAWYQRFAVNNNITIQEAFRLLTTRELEELRWTLAEYIRHGRENGLDGRWIREMENASAKVHIDRLTALKLEVEAELQQLTSNASEGIVAHVEDTYRESYYRTAYEIYKVTGEGVKLGGINAEKVRQIVSKPWAVDGRNFSERLWVDKTKLINKTGQILSTMAMTGSSPQKAIKELAHEMKVSTSQAGRVIMTETSAFRNTAHRDSMKEMDVEEYSIIAGLDGVTCPSCGRLDGLYFPMKRYVTGVTAPPFHPNCRCGIKPYSTKFDDLLEGIGKRAARGKDGKTYYVDRRLTYEEWKKDYT